MTFGRVLRLWFGFGGPIERRFYAASGLGLMLFKYLLDALLTLAITDHVLDPISYFNPILNQRMSNIYGYPWWFPGLMIACAVPFVWIGASMTIRRATHAGLGPATGLLFFVPYVNYLMMIWLCFAEGERMDPNSLLANQVQTARVKWTVAGQAALVTAALGVVAAAFSTLGLEVYGSSLFVGLPFLLGVVSGYLLNRKTLYDTSFTWAVAALSVTFCGGLMLLIALEGVMCLVMASVLAYPLALIGASVGRAIARSTANGLVATSSMVVAWPILALLPLETPNNAPLRTVVSRVEVHAPPEVVWQHVIAFPDLPPPSEWLMQTGIACPLRARIEGEGVGAVRYCEFTTGPFVEPITTWDPPHVLAFDVTSEPPSMEEWSPYEIVHAPHVVGGLNSRKGEFRLTRLPNGNTLLEGTTWYQLTMFPNEYWALFADHIVHVIHERVLHHVQHLSEAQTEPG
jgi:hypothetical protein